MSVESILDITLTANRAKVLIEYERKTSPYAPFPNDLVVILYSSGQNLFAC
jgi:hypothetical protein